MVYRQGDKAYTTSGGLYRLAQLVISVRIRIIETNILHRHHVLHDQLSHAHSEITSFVLAKLVVTS